MSLCPCGSQKTYEQCCELFLEKKLIPQTPEQLMRSRYSAYSLANIEYIKLTMKGKALIGFNEITAREWAKEVAWIGLNVIQSHVETSEKGFVEFAASFIESNQLKSIHELSEFHKENNRWFYVGGINQQLPDKKSKQIARNSPCPCNSGKKFKNCHAK